MCDRTSRPPTHPGAPTRDGLEDLINQYDEKVSAITRFEDQSSRIFQSDDGDKAWLDVCIAGRPPSLAPDSLVGTMRSRIHQTKQLEHLPEFLEAAL
jgi:hypothetical protein